MKAKTDDSVDKAFSQRGLLHGGLPLMVISATRFRNSISIVSR